MVVQIIPLEPKDLPIFQVFMFCKHSGKKTKAQRARTLSALFTTVPLAHGRGSVKYLLNELMHSHHTLSVIHQVLHIK